MPTTPQRGKASRDRAGVTVVTLLKAQGRGHPWFLHKILEGQALSRTHPSRTGRPQKSLTNMPHLEGKEEYRALDTSWHHDFPMNGLLGGEGGAGAGGCSTDNEALVENSSSSPGPSLSLVSEKGLWF